MICEVGAPWSIFEWQSLSVEPCWDEQNHCVLTCQMRSSVKLKMLGSGAGYKGRVSCSESLLTRFPSLEVKLFKFKISFLLGSEKPIFTKPEVCRKSWWPCCLRPWGWIVTEQSLWDVTGSQPFLTIHASFFSHSLAEISGRMLNKYSVMYLVAHFSIANMSEPLFFDWCREVEEASRRRKLPSFL